MEKFKPSILIALSLFLFLTACSETKNQEPWIDLLDGKILNGWTQKGGEANYKMENGTLVGTTVLNTPNSFLTTDKMYGDFILELEYKVDPKLNSGIQIRSNSLAAYRNGRVHGYQVEIDPSERSWSAGIYDEARRGWLYNLADNPNARKAFQQNEWNKYRIEAIGDTLKTWINDIPAVHLVDDMTKSGFIGLQVHGVGTDKEKEGIQVRWKNVKIITEELEKYTKPTTLSPKLTKNNLTDDEEKNGWKLLFDGKTFDGWRGIGIETIPKGHWKIENGNIQKIASGDVPTKPDGQPLEGGDLISKETFQNFELKFEWKISEGGNSGVKYNVDESISIENGSTGALGYECQVLDDLKHKDNSNPTHRAGSLYDMIEATGKIMKPVGAFNTARVVYNGAVLEHWLNGVKVIEANTDSPEFANFFKESKYHKYPNFNKHKNAHIVLQDHGDDCWFRNIKIKRIK